LLLYIAGYGGHCVIGCLKDQKAYDRMVESEAEVLERAHGATAYEMARAAMREAADNGDSGQEKFFAKVAATIVERTAKAFVRNIA
jgi:hypothetical protein